MLIFVLLYNIIIYIIIIVVSKIDASTPISGLNYTLSCDVSGIESVNTSTIRWTYNWSSAKNGNKTAIECNSNTLSFLHLKLSNAGEYICEVTIETDSNNLTLINSHDVIIQSELPFSTDYYSTTGNNY